MSKRTRLKMNKSTKKLLFFCIILFSTLRLNAQTFVYQSTSTKSNDLIHTKLDLHFDFIKKEIFGNAWINLKSNTYTTDSLYLDAKGMDIQNISIIKENGEISPLNYNYNGKKLSIQLNKKYSPNESYSIYLKYIAKPLETDEKGVHFINTDKKDKNLPFQIWTMGQPERNSTWFPTIDNPNQKTTLEISLTVPNKYSTLCNGTLISQKSSNDERTDTWEQKQPHAPYLTFFAIGDFKIIKDSWRGKEISYYIEPQFSLEPNIEEYLFPNTIEAIEYFSNLLDIEYPWDKYSQVRLRNFPGGMENTSATAMNEDGKSLKELADEEFRSGHIHELFHQWFGNYVTCKNWANTALNESFSDLSEILWAEYKFGKDLADRQLQIGLQSYLQDFSFFDTPLIRYDYTDPNQMFNGITYQKGGRILNMLRTYLGNEVFVLGIRDYLKRNAFGVSEANDLRISMETVSGEDLNWFFNEWFYRPGHPILNIDYVWDNKKKERHRVWIKNKVDTLVFKTEKKPLLINFDADKALITQKTDNKSLNEYIYQYYNAPLYLDRYESIEEMSKNLENTIVQETLYSALSDPFYAIRIEAIKLMDSLKSKHNNKYYTKIEKIATTDTSNLVKAAAIQSLGNMENSKYDMVFIDGINNTQSLAIQKASLVALFKSNPERGLEIAKQFENDSQKELHIIVIQMYSQYGGKHEWSYINNLFQSLSPPKQFNIINEYGVFVSRLSSLGEIKEAIIAIEKLGIIGKQHGIAPDIIQVLNLIKQNSTIKQTQKLIDKTIKKIDES